MHKLVDEHQLKPSVVPLSQASIPHFLSDNGIKPTRQRVAIATHMFKKNQHLAAETILELVNQDDSTTNVSKATVYNTLKLFVSKGILKEVAMDPQHVLFDTNTHNHHHILNTDTGEIRDIAPLDIDISTLPEHLIEHIEGVDLVIRVRNEKVD